jgi:hypothetical protein
MCENSRYFGGSTNEKEWFFQARTADNRLWTIGASGLPAPLLRAGDTVTFDVSVTAGLRVSPSTVVSSGQMNVSTSAGDSLLWVFAAGYGSAQIGGFDVNPGTPCGSGCIGSVNSVSVSSEATGENVVVPPSSSADIDGYHVVVGAVVVPSTRPDCFDEFGSSFGAAGVKLP